MGIYRSILLGCDVVRFAAQTCVEEDWQLERGKAGRQVCCRN